MSKVASLQSITFRKLLAEQKKQIKDFNMDVYQQMVDQNNKEFDKKQFDKLRANAQMCNRDKLQKLDKKQLIECLFRKYPQFRRDILEIRENTNTAEIAKRTNRVFTTQPTDIGMQYNKFLSILFKLMPDGITEPFTGRGNHLPTYYIPEVTGGVRPPISANRWNHPMWEEVTEANGRFTYGEGWSYEFKQFPRFTTAQYEKINKILVPYFQRLNPDIHGGSNNGYAWYINQVRTAQERHAPESISPYRLGNFMKSQIDWMDRQNLTELNTHLFGGSKIPKEYLKAWDRYKLYSDDDFDTKVQTRNKVFTYDQIIKTFLVFTKEQLIWLIKR